MVSVRESEIIILVHAVRCDAVEVRCGMHEVRFKEIIIEGNLLVLAIIKNPKSCSLDYLRVCK